MVFSLPLMKYTFFFSLNEIFLLNEMNLIFIPKSGIFSIYLQFAKGPLLKGLYWETWYNNQSVPEDQLGYIYYENKLLGVPRLRQLQVSSNSCVVHADFKDEIRDCYESYSESLENKSPFGEMDNSTAYVFHNFYCFVMVKVPEMTEGDNIFWVSFYHQEFPQCKIIVSSLAE